MYAQLGQDAWILKKYQTPGFFVDVGAYDGEEGSNTLALEERGWNGICIECDPKNHEACVKRRKCTVDNACVFDQPGQSVEFLCHYTLSGITGHFDDGHARNEGYTVSLTTQTLTEILQRYHAPRHIEYISIDTEGTELNVLMGLDFNIYQVDCFTVEHNYVYKKRQAVYDFLKAKGYILQRLDTFDDWFCRPEVL